MSRVLPILFNEVMVLAILDNRKFVTRRTMKKQPWDKCHNRKEHEFKNIFPDSPEEFCCRMCGQGIGPSGHSLFKSGYLPGDILYVRETWSEWTGGYLYKAWSSPFLQPGRCPDKMMKWHPSIHMPREAARIWLRVTDVKIERLQDMTLDDFLNEGISIPYEAFNDPENAYMQGRELFVKIWDSTINKEQHDLYGWNANPWVWVIEFEQCEKPESEVME